MGGGLSRVFNILGSSKKEQRIVMVGLDNAGKTTILYQVKMGEVVQTTPTIGTFHFFIYFFHCLLLSFFIFFIRF